jgi:hypothetical protein
MLTSPPFLTKVFFPPFIPPFMVFNKNSKLYAKENTRGDSAIMGT